LEQISGRLFDVVVIDGLERVELVPIAASILKPGGFILFDNSHWQGLIEAIAPYKFLRVDYYGGSPGVPLQACTSIFFAERCFVFEDNEAVKNLN